jgi:hypothetical protein
MPVDAKIAPKLKNIRRDLRKQGFFDIFSSILMVFLSLCLLRAILAQKENTFICEKFTKIFYFYQYLGGGPLFPHLFVSSPW